MASQPINDTFLMRWAIHILYKLLSIWWISRILSHTRLIQYIGPGVLIVLWSVCVKSTPFTLLAEASTMRFVSENTKIPVPKVYSAFEHRGRVYIILELIDGKCLAGDWCRRAPASRTRILDSLRSMMKQLRQIPNPAGASVSNIDGGPIYDQRLPGPHQWGPFRNIEDFHRELRGNFDEPVCNGEFIPDLACLIDFHKQPWPASVFTHGDLSSFNILARGDEVVGIVDWETAAWMPPYWEYTSTWHVNPYNPFWQEEVGRFLEPFPEALPAEIYRRKLSGD
ncbi:hypothetical protein NQ176_g7696 [Zarea fungicola]|uniref:Uncharacterized protein n=1 Tax=Zarea fungicola TaxID=93591 RepID=A0ACC1MZ32_9HYPO|nr:hypothetical protein NQ176_g7696 [Lecanicillium fungicola]